MHALVRRLRGVTAVALSWAVGWTLVGTLLGLVIRVIRPQDFDPGESVAGIAGLFAVVGFISGAAFALFFSLAERRRSLRDLSIVRSGVWGALGGAALPLFTTMNDDMAILLAPIGAVFATVTVALARRAARREEAVP
jgi:membrane associated rhomboid family serine protease